MTPQRPAGFLADPTPDEQVERLYAVDLESQGYVANLTRLWAHIPESLAVLSYVLKRATDTAGLDVRQRALLVTTSAATLGDAYCSLAFGSKLAVVDSDGVAAGAITGDDRGLRSADRTLAGWARRVVDQPNAVTPGDVEELRQLGYEDRQIFAITLFVALRLAFSTVNDALGAAPDPELVDRAPVAVRSAVTFGRLPTDSSLPAPD